MRIQNIFIKVNLGILIILINHLKTSLVIQTLALQRRPCAKKGEIATMSAFHRHGVQQPFAWNPNLYI